MLQISGEISETLSGIFKGKFSEEINGGILEETIGGIPNKIS